MHKRNSYHPAIKQAIALNLHNEFIDTDFLKGIAASTKNGWRNFKTESLVGHQYAKTIEDNLTDIKQYYERTSNFDRKVIKACLNFKYFITNSIDKNTLQNTFRSNKKQLVNTIETITNRTNIKVNKLCKLIGITHKTYYNWKSQVRFNCSASALKICAKRHPNQATQKEVNTITKLLTDTSKLHWSIASIKGYAFKNNLCILGTSTWYKYNNQLSIRKGLIKRTRKPKYKPLIAVKVNDIWHADITIFRTADRVKHYIYTVIDNYSRKTLAWQLADRVSADIRLQTIKDAIHLAYGNTPNNRTRLITDGGPENVNLTIKEFIRNSNFDINHQVAQKDIIQSNSMIEATYSTMKYRYLYRKTIENGEQLLKELEFFFEDYDNHRPHYAHKIYTPNEVYFGNSPEINLAKLYTDAAKSRRIANKNSNCKVC